MIVTSPDGKSTCLHWSVSILLLIRMRERVLVGSTLCVDGYTGIHSCAAIVVPKELIGGSWRATMLMPLFTSATLEMRECWQVLDLFCFVAIC